MPIEYFEKLMEDFNFGFGQANDIRFGYRCTLKVIVKKNLMIMLMVYFSWCNEHGFNSVMWHIISAI